MVANRLPVVRRGSAAATLAIVVAMTAMSALLAGCNTTQGFGEDVQSAGRGIQNSAEKNK